MQGKLIIFSAPSGSGKSTIVNHLLQQNFNLEFSISATTRNPRGTEQHGVEYYFFSVEAFQSRIAGGEFVEYEEVYAGRYYGTLRSELERIWSKNHNVVFDVDVKGGIRLKQIFGTDALSVFIQPPSIEELRKRLHGRGTDSEEEIERRVAKAAEEMSYASQFDHVVVNDNLQTAITQTEELLRTFLQK